MTVKYVNQSSIPVGQSIDLDNEAAISLTVDTFYERLLNDDLMAPVFLEVAGVDLRAHLPTISLYWQKMLLGDGQYQNNTMAKHRIIHAKAPFEPIHFDHWLQHFLDNLDSQFAGPYTDRARKIATNVIKNMKKQLLSEHLITRSTNL